MTVLKVESNMALVEIIKKLRKQVGFYRLYLAMDKVTNQEKSNNFANEKIDTQTIQIAELAKSVQ